MPVLQAFCGQPSSRSGHLPLATMVLCCIAAVAAMVPGLQPILQLDVSAIQNGEVWRFLTGHLTHWTTDHLLWDIAVFAAVGALCERRSRSLFLATTLISAGAISTWMMWAPDGLQTYRGLSGIDTALFGLLATLMLAEAQANSDRLVQWIVGMGLVGLILKTWWEFHSDGTVFVNQATEFVAVPMAHVAGGLTGLLVALISLAARETRWISRLAVCDATDDLAW